MRCISAKSLLYSVIITCLAASVLSAITYFHVLVEDTVSHVQVQGESQAFDADCDTTGMVELYYYADLDSSGTVDVGEYSVFQMMLVDNSSEFPPDTDPTTGLMNFPWPLNMPPGHYVITASDATDTLEYPYSVYAPDTVTHSVSGTVTMEGITPPDPLLAQTPVMSGTMSPPLLMYFIPDEMGEYSFNWPGGDATIMFMVPWDIPGYEFEDPGMLTVDGHITDFDIHFSRAGLSEVTIYVDSSESDHHVQGQLLEIEMDCAEGDSSFVWVDVIRDLNGNGVMDAGEPSLLPGPWSILDNGWEGFPRDDNFENGIIRARLPNLPPGDYVIHADDGIDEATAPLTVEAPSPLIMSISGRITLDTLTPPNSLLNGLFIAARDRSDPEVVYSAVCDSMGDYTCNWAEGASEVEIFFPPPYASTEWSFASETLVVDVDGHETGANIIVPLSAYPDSILVNFKADSGGWDVSQSELKASYIDPATREIIGTTSFPDSGDIYLQVRPDSFGILFQPVDTVHFPQHQFISPYDTIWMSESLYPPDLDVFVNLTNYHFLLYFDHFDLDSVPEDGIPVELFGLDSLGNEYYTEFRVFIGYYDSVYLVASERELCDGWWTLVLPDTLPANYIPAVTETTFYIPEVGDWPWYAMHIPVDFESIAEGKLPGEMALGVHPNPFNSAAAVDFYIDEPGPAKVEIYNIMGERIVTLIDDNLDEGLHRAVWNATTSEGRRVPSGVYFFRLSANKKATMKRALFIR